MIALAGVLSIMLCLAATSAQPATSSAQPGLSSAQPGLSSAQPALSSAQPALSSAADSWTWPVEAPYRILRPFIAPSTPYSAGHRGIDVAAPSARVFAPSAGIVHFAGVVVDRPVLSIRHSGGVISSYEPVTAAVVKGQAVARGEVIGEVLPGHCSVLCVHFGVRRDGEYVSPLNYLGGIPRSILLPTR